MLGWAYEVDKVENMEDKRFSKKKKYIGSWGQKDEIGKGGAKIGSNLAVNTPFGPLRGQNTHRDDTPKRQ